jgi:hypothetical protein
MKTHIICLFLLFLGAQIAFAQKRNTLDHDSIVGSPTATLKEVAWIAGHWKGAAMGAYTEEIWTLPAGKAMMGSFRLYNEVATNFYELCTITEENNTLLLRIKHFNDDLKGWEEKDKSTEFKLVKITPNRIYFSGLTFERVGKNTLNIYVVMHQKDGSVQEMEFSYQREKK